MHHDIQKITSYHNFYFFFQYVSERTLNYFNSVLSLLGTLESISALLGTLRLCQILWTVQNPAYLSAFIKKNLEL